MISPSLKKNKPILVKLLTAFCKVLFFNIKLRLENVQSQRGISVRCFLLCRCIALFLCLESNIKLTLFMLLAEKKIKCIALVHLHCHIGNFLIACFRTLHVWCVVISEVEDIKDKFKEFSSSTREETEQIKKLSNETHSTLLNVQVGKTFILIYWSYTQSSGSVPYCKPLCTV